MRRACSLLSASGVYAPFRLVLFNICSDATKPCRPISVQTRRPMWGPSRQSRLPDETLGEMKGGGRMEGKLIQELEGGRGGGEWRKMRVGNRRRKTMRQNQKINEALFQWQDLCTVNITLAIRGNPITLCLSSPFSLGGRK